MKTIVRTKVYEIRESRKGGSWTFEMFFDKQKALKRAEDLIEKFKGTGSNFKILEHNTVDIICYTEE